MSHHPPQHTFKSTANQLQKAISKGISQGIKHQVIAGKDPQNALQALSAKGGTQKA